MRRCLTIQTSPMTATMILTIRTRPTYLLFHLCNLLIIGILNFNLDIVTFGDIIVEVIFIDADSDIDEYETGEDGG